MSKKAILVLFVALTLVMAGCMGGGGDGQAGDGSGNGNGATDGADGSSDGSDGSDGDGSDGSDGSDGAGDGGSDGDGSDGSSDGSSDGAGDGTSDGSDSGSDGGMGDGDSSDGDSGDGSDSGGDSDFIDDLYNQPEKLKNAGSFTSVQKVIFSVVEGGEEQTVIDSTDTYMIDYGNDRYYQKTEGISFFGPVNREKYTSGGDTFVKNVQTVNGKEQVQYAQTNDDPVDPADAAWGDTLEDPDQDEEFMKYVTNKGKETFDGTTVTRYEVNGVEALKAMGTSAGVDYESVTEYRAVLLVDNSGITRYLYTTMTFEEEGETTVIELEVRITKVGSTTVQEPDWVSKARQQTALP